MIVFSHTDDKSKCLKDELITLGIKSDSVKTRHPVLAPFYLLKLLLKRKKIKVYVFRYLNDSESLFIAYLRVISEALIILLSKIFKFKIWWLCHNVDQETNMFYPKLTKIRRYNVVKHSQYIFTTNELLIPKAKQLFKNKKIDSLSLGYIENGFLKIKKNEQVEKEIVNWITKRNDGLSKFLFCIGSPANKSIHFKLISSFIDTLNQQSNIVTWYAVVIGDSVEENKFILNIPYKLSINPNIIRKYASFYYRIIDDYSMSYSIFEAAHYKIPIITENYGLLPEIISKYKIGLVIKKRDAVLSEIENFSYEQAGFDDFLNDNNWKVAASQIQNYYNKI